MTLDEIISNVRRHELVPVRLANDPSDDDQSFWTFEGSVDEFLGTVKLLGAKAVYVVTATFLAEFLEFSHEADDSDDDQDEGLGEDTDETSDSCPVDLGVVEPRLAAFKSVRVHGPEDMSIGLGLPRRAAMQASSK